MSGSIRKSMLATGAFVLLMISAVTRGQQVDKQAILDNSAKTKERIAREGVAWTKIIDPRAGAIIRVDEMVHGGQISVKLSINVADKVYGVTQLIQTKGKWYVTQANGQQIYRPH